MQLLYLIYSLAFLLFIKAGLRWFCVEDMQPLLILHYRNGDGGLVNGNLRFL